MRGVIDEFVSELLAYLGCDLKELSVADCGKLIDGALEAIGAVCYALNALILDNLSLLTDTTLVHLANGCRSLQTLSLKRCSFSDEDVVAFIGASGNCLFDLSLNNVKEDYSEISLAYRPSHADATCDFKYGVRSVQGGGRSSTHETIGRVATRVVAKKILQLKAETENPHVDLNGAVFTTGWSKNCNLCIKDPSISTVLCKLKYTLVIFVVSSILLVCVLQDKMTSTDYNQ